MASTYKPLDRLRMLLQDVRNLEQQQRFERTGHSAPESPEPFDHIEHMSQALLFGALPGPETLMFVAVAMDKYVHTEGKLSLDEAFDLHSKQRIGNPSKVRATRNKRMVKLFEMACLRADDQSLSLAAAAAKVVPDDPEGAEADTLVRDYKRHNCRTWEASTPASIDAKVRRGYWRIAMCHESCQGSVLDAQRRNFSTCPSLSSAVRHGYF